MKKWIVLAVAMVSLSAGAHDRDSERDHNRRRDNCHRQDRQLRQRTAQQVLVSHRAALAAGDWDVVACNYAEEAVVISDGGVMQGRDATVAALQQLSGFFGGTIPMVNEEVIVSILKDRAEMARVLFSISTPCVDINDGADTYIIKNGQIQAQTAHGFPIFKCAP